MTVYATARRIESIADLEASGCRILQLDVTSEASMVAAVRAVEDAEGAVSALGNNAGYALYGAIESLNMDDVHRQFETNVFGALRLAQLVIPGMRRQHFGRIVNVGSIGGRLTYPAGGAYHMTKYAMEAMSDALRFETRGFGIRVSHVQPGFIRTQWGETALRSVPGETTGPYAKLHKRLGENLQNAYHGRLASIARGPEAAAEVIEHAIRAKRPKTRYRVAPSAAIMLTARHWLPDPVFDFMLRRWYPTPR